MGKFIYEGSLMKDIQIISAEYLGHGLGILCIIKTPDLANGEETPFNILPKEAFLHPDKNTEAVREALEASGVEIKPFVQTVANGVQTISARQGMTYLHKQSKLADLKTWVYHADTDYEHVIYFERAVDWEVSSNFIKAAQEYFSWSDEFLIEFFQEAAKL